MRLNPGINLASADDALGRAAEIWGNARSTEDPYVAYTDAVYKTYSILKHAFAVPDIGGHLHSPAYWNLLPIARAGHVMGGPKEPNDLRARRAEIQAIVTEIEEQIKFLQQARVEMAALQKLAERSGLPVVYDTNMLLHWRQPGDVLWGEILKAQDEDVSLTRLVVPLQVIDELDRQKYGEGQLAVRAATAIRYLARILGRKEPGEQVELRKGATLEVWVDTDDRGSDVDLSILRCAVDLANLHPGTGARVLTDDTGMRLRAEQMGLKVVRLPEDHRKPGTAMNEVPPM